MKWVKYLLRFDLILVLHLEGLMRFILTSSLMKAISWFLYLVDYDAHNRNRMSKKSGRTNLNESRFRENKLF